MDDKTYIAGLEKLLDAREVMCRYLITICEKLVEKRKEQEQTILVYAATITEQDADLETLREEALDNYETINALKADNVKLVNANKELKKEITYLNSIIDGANA